MLAQDVQKVSSLLVVWQDMVTPAKLVTLPSCQPSTPAPILEHNTTNHPDLPSDYFEEDISPAASNNNKEEIRTADTTGNDDENSRPADIDK